MVQGRSSRNAIVMVDSVPPVWCLIERVRQGKRLKKRVAQVGRDDGHRTGEDAMTTKTFWETFKAEGENVVEKVKQIVHEGNVRRVVVKHDGRKVAEFPLTAGVVGAVLAPVLAAIGALVALMKECTIEIERTSFDGSTRDAVVAEADETANFTTRSR
jgi:hypothetical protein